MIEKDIDNESPSNNIVSFNELIDSYTKKNLEMGYLNSIEPKIKLKEDKYGQQNPYNIPYKLWEKTREQIKIY